MLGGTYDESATNASVANEPETPSHYYPAPVRVIDEDYDADGVPELLALLQRNELASGFGLGRDEMDDELDRLTMDMPRLCTLNET